MIQQRFMKQNTILLLIVTFIKVNLLFGQEKISFSFANAKNRKTTALTLKREIDSLVYASSNPGKDENKWLKAFWAMELMLYAPKEWEAKIPRFIEKLPGFNPEMQRAFLEMLYTLYPLTFGKELLQVWPMLENAKNQAMALEYLANAQLFPEISSSHRIYHSGWHRAYQKRWFSAHCEYPGEDHFLHAELLKEADILCSFQYSDRNIPGYLMIRKKNGTWLADQQGNPLKFMQLARSISNLPYYLTNGNTPQGLYRITGYDHSDNGWIGPTKNVQMVMPFENDNSFFKGYNTGELTYKQLLMPVIEHFPSLWEVYEAGKLGRSEIIAHGTTINPTFYEKAPYFPCTPSLGCLCSPEKWNKRGQRTKSTQQAWINTLEKERINPEWLIVVEIGRSRKIRSS